jgi:hypothetical protein
MSESGHTLPVLSKSDVWIVQQRTLTVLKSRATDNGSKEKSPRQGDQYSPAHIVGGGPNAISCGAVRATS